MELETSTLKEHGLSTMYNVCITLLWIVIVNENKRKYNTLIVKAFIRRVNLIINENKRQHLNGAKN